MINDIYEESVSNKIKEYGKPAAGWFCSYTPVEIIDAAGYTPVRISGARTSSGAADSIMHTNICPYIKACVEAAESGDLDFLDCVVFTNGCDAQRRLYDIWKSRKPDMPIYLLTIPKKNTPVSVALLSGQIAALTTWFKKQTGKEIGDERIIDSIKTYKELRAIAAKLDEKRRDAKAPIAGSRFAGLMLGAQRMPAADAIRMLSDALEKGGEAAQPGPAVIIAGNMLDDPDWIRMIESYGARVVADDLCAGRRFWEMPEPDESAPPFAALAEAYLSKPPCPRMAVPDDSVAYMKRLVESVRPDGVIFYILKFCDTHLYNVPEMRRMMQDLDIRALFIEGDYTTASGQAATRIQAFIEML
ncbi:MAG: 2-hydroxyacyl-CoA dehydratase family protein [bacterium]